jgi:hypothetical protein
MFLVRAFKVLSILSRPPKWFHRQCARVQPRLKAALVDAGLRLMGRPRAGRLTTKVVQSVVTALVRLAGLAHV